MKNNINTIEYTIFLYSLLCSIFLGVFILVNNYLNNGRLIISTVVGAALLILVSIFYFVWKRKIHKPFLFPFHLLVISVLIYGFLQTGGIFSTVPFLMLMHLISIIITVPPKFRFLSTLSYIFVLLGLIVINKVYPEIIYGPNELTILSIPYFYILSLLLIAILVYVVKLEYDKDRLINYEQNLSISQINKELEKKVRQRSEILKIQNEKLINYSYYNAHKVRGPLCRIMGILNLMQHNNISNDYITHLQAKSKELNTIVAQINQILEADNEQDIKIN